MERRFVMVGFKPEKFEGRIFSCEELKESEAMEWLGKEKFEQAGDYFKPGDECLVVEIGNAMLKSILAKEAINFLGTTLHLVKILAVADRITV